MPLSLICLLLNILSHKFYIIYEIRPGILRGLELNVRPADERPEHIKMAYHLPIGSGTER